MHLNLFLFVLGIEPFPELCTSFLARKFVRGLHLYFTLLFLA